MSALTPSRSAPVFCVLLAIVFVATQVTVLSHEFAHLLHQHDAPCALHVAADHLTMVAPPEPAMAVAPVSVAGALSPPRVILLPFRAGPTEARAPPRPA
jgi:hypothetical protein